MRNPILLACCVLMVGSGTSCRAPARAGGATGEQSLLEELLTVERSALDRWVKVDPQGYLDLYAPEVTYFDPFTERRVDGLAAMEARVAPMRGMKSPITDPRYEISGPKVQRYGSVALLSFNLVNHGRVGNGPERVLARWNSTEVYARTNGAWKIIHSHWSFTKPEIKPPGS
jgi:ketosteroid isomerase-like protein